MSFQQNGITLSPKTLMTLIAVGGILITIGGYVSVVKDAPKEISALAIEHRSFEKVAHEVHHGFSIKDNEHDIKLAEIRTNQTHMMKGIDNIQIILQRTGRRPSRSSLREEEGG